MKNIIKYLYDPNFSFTNISFEKTLLEIEKLNPKKTT